MAIRGYSKTGLAGAAIKRGRLLKFGADRHHFVQADGSAGEIIIGVADTDAEIEAPIDAVMDRIPEVGLGGVVKEGDPLKSNADGRAIKAVADDLAFGVAWVDGIADTTDEPGGEILIGRFKV